MSLQPRVTRFDNESPRLFSFTVPVNPDPGSSEHARVKEARDSLFLIMNITDRRTNRGLSVRFITDT